MVRLSLVLLQSTYSCMIDKYKNGGMHAYIN